MQFYIARVEGGSRLVDEKWRGVLKSGGYLTHVPKGPDVATWSGEWSINFPFPKVEYAVDAVVQLRLLQPSACQLGVKDEHGQWVWNELIGYHPEPQPQEDKTRMEYEDKKPLHVPREALIGKLQENLDAEQAKREEAEAAIAKRRQEAIDAVTQFNGDELVNLLVRCGYAVSDMAEMVKEAKEAKRFVSPESQPSVKESELEKYVRVLSLATDKEIEITPDTEIYRLL